MYPGSRESGSTFDPEFEDSHSDEEEKSPIFLRSRRASASTLQSFMLYTPDEERSVVSKFDRRLVLFVAFLYLLSFLDRSSRFLRPIVWSALTSAQISEMRGLLVYRKIYIQAHCNMNGYFVLLHHIHIVRVDDALVAGSSSAYLPYGCSFPMPLYDFAS